MRQSRHDRRQHGWSWDDCLPYFRKAERWEGEETAVRGKDGPLLTSKMDRSAICATVIEAGKELELEYREDLNVSKRTLVNWSGQHNWQARVVE